MLPRQHRLPKQHILPLIRTGWKIRVDGVLMIYTRTTADISRFAIVIQKGKGTAVARNRIKRIVRIRINENLINRRPSIDAVVLARTKDISASEDLKKAFEHIQKKLP